MNKKYSSKAFTLIEILVAITIIGIFIGLVVYISGDSTKLARDSERKTDISEIREALQMYASNNYGYYPVQDDDWCCIDATSGELQCDNITTLISNLPTDALYPQEYETGKPYAYYYKTENEGESYKIYAVLEEDVYYYCSSEDIYPSEVSSIPGGGYGGWSCGDDITFTYNGASVTYGTVESNGECWMDRNLGATQVATAYNDSAAYGDYFQWGRLDDGHQSSSSTTTTLSSTDDPGHSSFILINEEPYDWRSPQNHNLWQGVDGINNPCPNGWRIATTTEWSTELASWGTEEDYRTRAFNSPLKLTAPGYRNCNLASVFNAGWNGVYWSFSTGNDYSYTFGVSSTNAGISTINYRFHANGRSIRCIKD